MVEQNRKKDSILSSYFSDNQNLNLKKVKKFNWIVNIHVYATTLHNEQERDKLTEISTTNNDITTNRIKSIRDKNIKVATKKWAVSGNNVPRNYMN